MLDLKFVRENPDIVKQNIKNKFQDRKLPLVDEVIELDAQARATKTEADELRANRNKLSKQIGALMAQGKKEEAETVKAQVNTDADRLKELEAKETELNEKVTKIMMTIPNIIDPSVPIGKDDSENVEIEKFGEPVVPDFEIPYHMLIKDDEKIEFNYNGTKCSVLSRTIRTQDSSFIIGNNIYTQKDKYGIINHSILTVEIGRYINGNELVQVNRAIDSVYAPLTEAIDVYNYFVKKYIISTNRYWIPEINENMIFRFETKVFAGNIEIKNIPFSTSMSISSTGSNELCLSVEEIKKIKEELKSTDDLIWRIAVNYAKNYYLIKDYKNAIIMINIALENFSYKFARDKLVEYMSDSEIEEFFNGKVKYEDYFLKDYIEKEDFEKAKKNGIIKDNPPTIYKIYTECYKYEKFKISKSKLNKKISLIKDQRNEIVHGKKISKNLRYVAENAIEEFEELVKELN